MGKDLNCTAAFVQAVVQNSGQLWVASLGVNTGVDASLPGTKITRKRCSLSKFAVTPRCSAQRIYWRAGLLFRERGRLQGWIQGSLKELSKCESCALILGSFSKRVASMLGINYFPPLGICTATSHVQCLKHCPSLGEMYWYRHGEGWSTQLTGGAEGAGLAQPRHKKGKWRPALVFNHLDRGLEKMEPDPSRKRAVKDWRSVRKSQQGKLELGIRWGEKNKQNTMKSLSSAMVVQRGCGVSIIGGVQCSAGRAPQQADCSLKLALRWAVGWTI